MDTSIIVPRPTRTHTTHITHTTHTPIHATHMRNAHMHTDIIMMSDMGMRMRSGTDFEKSFCTAFAY
jgi:hypothetical protein